MTDILYSFFISDARVYGIVLENMQVQSKSGRNISKGSFIACYNTDIDVIFLFVRNGPPVTHNHS